MGRKVLHAVVRALSRGWLRPALAAVLLLTGTSASVRAQSDEPQVCPSGVCATPVAWLPDPTTSCQSTSLALTCTNPATYGITLVQGQTYTFTACGATCAGAGAAFDSRIELYRGALLVASSSNACGTNGEVVYSAPALGGGGPYCVSVVPEIGMGDFTLSYRITCQAPSNLLIGPTSGGTSEQACASDVTFSVNSAGTGPYQYDWTISPPAGGSAVPATRTITRPENGDSFTTSLTGLGAYTVQVAVTNDCGSDLGAIAFELEDVVAPDIVCTATRVPCPAPAPRPLLGDRSGATAFGGSGDAAAASRSGSRRVSAAPRPPHTRGSAASAADIARRLESSRGDVAEVLLGATTTAEARTLIARKLDLTESDVVVRDGRDWEFFRRPGQAAVSCPTPCTSGVLGATHPYYDVFMACGQGFYSARTGASHSVSAGGAENVIYGGQQGSAVTSDFSFRFHNSGLTRLAPLGGRACAFDPPDTPSEPSSIGLEQEWTLDTLAPGISPVIAREEIVAFGSTEANSGIRLTLGVMNPATSTATLELGVRWQIDYQNAADDGPGIATVLCSPFTIGPERFTEHEFLPTEILDFYRIQNDTGRPIFGNYTSTARVAGFPDTRTPDRLIYGEWPYLRGSAWDVAAREGRNADSDSATLVYYGYQPADAIRVAPGQAVTRSVVIFTSGQQQSCGEFIPGTGVGASIEVCENDCVELGASSTDSCVTPAVRITGSSLGAPPCTGNPCTVAFPSAGTYAYTWQATDSAANATTCRTEVVVRNCVLAVRFDTYAASRLPGGGVEVTWRTLEESDTSFFVVERGVGAGSPWSAIADPVSAVGPGFPYRFLDPTAEAELSWYRVVEYTSSGRGDQTPGFPAR